MKHPIVIAIRKGLKAGHTAYLTTPGVETPIVNARMHAGALEVQTERFKGTAHWLPVSEIMTLTISPADSWEQTLTYAQVNQMEQWRT